METCEIHRKLSVSPKLVNNIPMDSQKYVEYYCAIICDWYIIYLL